ncbi:conserved Plasmodium protein, unknown function [Plasmodium chabaudi chabaudi]|uniref:Uncharacterized protein n=1 Tax=Plasmodium chabaudi chabaudi TaxID=31271 RepID=A0A4V0K5V1_PLACU|nr:conserved Plasmodium protein, unknown function [Plasmodium chabaudi chabaudi]VTZ67503.1 conserved Plasmodium protein, unknown function [Plasmodium chabaudi chabaudi]|eukprot:XP_742481.2 conserved Plasmodium protein, unknown function [Plasmodium chabaudi chabaudi]
MKITKKETYNKNKSADINEKLISEYYDIIPHMENEIENLLKKFNVKKYDHKITTLLIDIIQNETLKILLSSKKIQKRTKANTKTNSDQPDFDQKNEDNQATNTSQEVEKKETIDDSPSHPNDEPNYISKADSFDQKNDGSQISPNIDNLMQSENVESISKNTQSASEENVGNAENNKNDQSKENEIEKNSEEAQPKEEEKTGGLFKTISSFFSKKDNEEEKKIEDSEKTEDPSKDTKLNTDNNSIQNEKENLVNDTTQLDDPKGEEKSSLLTNNDKSGEAQEMETSKDISKNNNGNKIGNAENINEKNNASEENLDKINYDGTELVNKNDENKKNGKNENNNANVQEEAEDDILIIDEESVNQAIREYALKYIYRKKNVDFVYDDPTYEQKDINNVFVDRNIKYPMGFPPHLPDDCSINTILPSWNIQYDFTKKNKNNQYRL